MFGLAMMIVWSHSGSITLTLLSRGRKRRLPV
jgi:hypothetical protein